MVSFKHSPRTGESQGVADWFAADGPLARVVAGYAPRGAQVEMAVAVAETLAHGGILVAEAGTGTGKTFAYLLPALLSGKQVIVATGSRNLQDQLVDRDLPRLRQALRRPFRVVPLKGRGNYLCHYRLQQSLDGDLFRDEADRRALARVRRWASATAVGDIAELAELPEDWPGWPRLTSTEDTCLGQDCPFVADCFLLRARRKALEADLVVVNHHLLCADWALRQEGYGSLLPDADAVIVDEAHQFADTAARFLGETLTARQIQELMRDVVTEMRQARLAAPPVRTALAELQGAVRQALAAFAGGPGRGAAAELPPAAEAALATVDAALAALAEALGPLAGAEAGLTRCCERAERLAGRLRDWRDGDREGWVRWFEAGSRRFALHATPLAVGGAFAGYRKRFEAAWVFTSATLSVAGGFGHFLAQLGLAEDEVDCRIWPSPFDYRRQALLYLPPGLPAPAASDYTRRLIAAVRPVLEASGGRAFLLFTSHRALNEAAALLADLPWPCLVQGQAPKAVLLARFRELGNAVLLGTASFWEGVDVRGPALSCVIIDKLPFASPADPVCQARLASLRDRGYDPFPAWQLPAAVIALKQGVGRLIRDAGDRGVLVLCDPRLKERGYGKVFLDSLPPMPHTTDPKEVERFFLHEDPRP